jgi:hypothetical protein
LKTKIKVVTGKILFELAIVALGILLAIAINSQYQGYQQKKQADNFLKKIEYEINSNLKNLDEVNTAFGENIVLTDDYISELKRGEKVDINYSLKLLDVGFGVWKFTQHREELDQLPVDILIAISESYRALEKAELYTSELIITKFEKLKDNPNANANEIELLIKLSREFKYAKFHLDLAKAELKNCIDIIEQYYPT